MTRTLLFAYNGNGIAVAGMTDADIHWYLMAMLLV